MLSQRDACKNASENFVIRTLDYSLFGDLLYLPIIILRPNVPLEAHFTALAIIVTGKFLKMFSFVLVLGPFLGPGPGQFCPGPHFT